jgi:hypothetical protein
MIRRVLNIFLEVIQNRWNERGLGQALTRSFPVTTTRANERQVRRLQC